MASVLAGAGAGAFTGPLDGITSALALSVRRLYATYTGDCMLLRRSSDNAEQAFGFTSLGALDASAITTWLAGADAYIKTWYDQSGNARDFSETDAGDQLRLIVSAIGGKPSARSDASSWLARANTALFTGNQAIIFEIGRYPSGAFPTLFDKPSRLRISIASSARKQIIVGDGTTTSTHTSSISGFPADADFIGTYVLDGTSKYFYNNGVDKGSVSATGEDLEDAATTTRIFTSNEVGSNIMDLSELIMCDALLSDANINVIGGSAGAYYGTGWTNLT